MIDGCDLEWDNFVIQMFDKQSWRGYLKTFFLLTVISLTPVKCHISVELFTNYHSRNDNYRTVMNVKTS